MRMKTLCSLAIATLGLFIASCKKDVDNKPPLVDAGASKTITDTTTLSGSATDPDGKVVAYLWSEVSGPGSSIIVNPGSASTQVRGFTAAGKYIFQLEATDEDGATGVDTVSITVNLSLETQTLTLQPSNNPTEMNFVNFNGLDQSGLSGGDLPVEAWTSGGNPFTVRSAIKFDLSSIPSTATIISANLYMYSYPAPTLNGNFTDPNFGTGDQMLVQRITANWSPSTANWSNQPATTTTGQLVVPAISTPLDLNLDVTSMIASEVNGNATYGFFFKIQNEVIYNSRIFVSSTNNTYPAKHPKLVVVYR